MLDAHPVNAEQDEDYNENVCRQDDKMRELLDTIRERIDEKKKKMK